MSAISKKYKWYFLAGYFFCISNGLFQDAYKTDVQVTKGTLLSHGEFFISEVPYFMTIRITSCANRIADKMADDMFGDSALFEEFDKDREPLGSFIIYKRVNEGEKDQSKFILQFSDSSSSDESDEDEQKMKVKEQSHESVGHAVTQLQKKASREESEGATVNGEIENADGSSSSESDEDISVNGQIVSKERVEKATTYKLTYERILSVG